MHEGRRERLRVRYEEAGIKGFAEHEALELLLTYAIPRKDTNGIAHRLLNAFGSIDAVLNAQIKELTRIDGIGRSAAVLLTLQGELAREFPFRESKNKRPRLHSPQAAAAFALAQMRAERYECAYAVSLDKNYRLLHATRVSSGTIGESPIYPRLIVEAALQNGAHAVLLLHNHPSGDPRPSKSDITATAGVKAALNSIDIQLYDHIVVGEHIVYSISKQIYIDRSGGVHTAMPG